jgi:hypothetical protein
MGIDCRLPMIAALALACGIRGEDTGEQFGESTEGGTDITSGIDPGATETSPETDEPAPGGDGVKYDVGPGTGTEQGGGGCGPNGDLECGCDAVDVLFIVDNSGSMRDHQVALTNAFPEFVGAMVDVLPSGTSLHFGVTSTEMGYASAAENDGCSYAGDATRFYVTPDVENTERNGAQGRLFVWEGIPYYEATTDAPQSEIEAMAEWFGGAAIIGTGGSNVEMSSAAAAWAVHPANQGTNAGFVRDQGALLVLFFIQDEPDQTPEEPEVMLEMLAAAKQECGGTNCIVGGGLVNTGCLGEVPLGGVLAGLGAPPVIAAIPYFAGSDPTKFVEVLRDTLADLIAEKCEDIPAP